MGPCLRRPTVERLSSDHGIVYGTLAPSRSAHTLEGAAMPALVHRGQREGPLKVLAMIGAVLLAALGIASFACYRTLAVPDTKPVSQENLLLCRSVVRRRGGYPWVYTNALKTGMCPCQPCDKLAREREATQ